MDEVSANLIKKKKKVINEIIAFLKYHPDNPAIATVVINNEKLTWAGSTRLWTNPSFTINSDKVPVNVDSVEIEVVNDYIRNYKMKNVVGKIPGENPDSVLVFSAHYDHLGMMGPAIFPGANDNASGVAMLLNIAKYYTKHKPKYSIVLMAFGGEELGLLGSDYYANNPLFPLSDIKFFINFDIAGTGDEGIQIVNSKVYSSQFDLMNTINNDLNLLPQIKVRGEACNSDHCPFYKRGVPSFFIYTLGGVKAYHDIYDKSETLPLTVFENYVKLVVEFVERL